MSRTADPSLKALEVFQLVARLGSVQAVAVESGLSISTVSHHLKSLEAQVGVALLDHKRRPMVLTPQGAVFLKYVEEALRLIRKARSEAVAGDTIGVRSLRLGLIEDFDSDIAPQLAVQLAETMPFCDFSHFTRPSHDILHLLRNRRIDIGLASRPVETVSDLQESQMLRDPFVLALPVGYHATPEATLAGDTDLPLLRYSTGQIVSGQIEAHLRRLRLSHPQRFEIESNQTIMAMIAAGAGWAITTPLCYMRAKRFQGQVRLHPFPGKGFARYISLFASPECSEPMATMVGAALRSLLERNVVRPLTDDHPWLCDSFRML
ncbi:LysR family transcriptional regulator [Aliisedimentitalea scapharcae]|uniref:LysR family transcriptional regulator n=1 Tax=Aliisedimentitalea scapharcae TaxID=1524259 RepID=A0ABZ2XRL5_9RHOB